VFVASQNSIFKELQYLSMEESNMNTNYELLGKSVRKYRLLADLTQEKLGELAGVSLSHINAIENANGIPSIEVVVSISNVLNVTMDQLFYGSISNSSGYLMDEFNRLTEGYDVDQKRFVINMAVAVWEQYMKYTREKE
jgi:transcriptional regulator with XRE-family HTH domain